MAAASGADGWPTAYTDGINQYGTADDAVRAGLGRTVAACDRVSTSYQIREHIRSLGAPVSEATMRPNPTMRLELSGPPLGSA